jgi:CubicO group peptidase (beta-lactamase class C family)
MFLLRLRIDPRLRYAILVIASVAGLLWPLHAATDANSKSGIDEEGFVRNWLVLLPIPFGANETSIEALDREQIKDEAHLKPKLGDKVRVGRKNLVWRKATPAGYLLDFNAILGRETEDSIAYAVSYIVAPKDLKKIKMKTGSDDLCKIYLNGKEVFKNTEERGPAKDQDTTEISLRRGINVLVARVINVEQGWAFCLRFTDQNDQPLTTLNAQIRLGDRPDLPATGVADKRLAAFDRLMIDFMEENPDVTGATLAVAHDGKVVYSRGFGHADGKMAMQPDAKMRIASISKPITAVAILRLIERGLLKLDDKVFEILDLEEPKKGFDPRWRRVTIQQLLQHTGGWDREKSGCPMFRSGAICKELGINGPAMPKDIIRHMLGQPLDFNPGERYAYSNFGYCLLGRVIEKVTGQTYEDHVRREILEPAGALETRLGKTLHEHRLPGEVSYDVGGKKGNAVLGPDLGKPVLLPYGTWCLEAMDSHGGWVASAPDLVRFASAFDHPDRCPLLKAKSIDTMFACPVGPAGHDKNGRKKEIFYGCGWLVHPRGQGVRDTWHDGQLAGTSTLLLRLGGGNVTCAVLFNGYSFRKAAPADLIAPLLRAAVQSITDWPGASSAIRKEEIKDQADVQLIADLEKQIPKLMEEAKVPGLSIAIIKDAKLLWRRGFGVKEATLKEPVDNDTLFEAASTSKPIFAYLLMKLCEKGVINLDTPLTKYTPERFLKDDPRLDLITARHVLSHTSGFQNWRTKEDPLKVHFNPGEKWSYSGEGYSYLQSVVTHLTGKVNPKERGTFEAGLEVFATDIDEYMKANILTPFGMTSSGYIWNDTMEKHMARGHDPKGHASKESRKPTGPGVARYAAAGGLCTTPTDYAKFLIQVIDPKPSDAFRLNRDSLKEMLRPQVKRNAQSSWALGWEINHTDKGDFIRHGGGNPGFDCFVAASVERKSGFVIMTNSENGYYGVIAKLITGETLSRFLGGKLRGSSE